MNLYTVGYTGLTPSALLAAAETLGAVIADIRIAPRSPNPVWNKRRLAEAWGPRYRHVGELGNRNYKGEFGSETLLVDEAEGVRIIAELLQQQPVILMCACVDAAHCHRTPAAEAVAAQTGAAITHLSAADIERLATGQQGF
jgi:uncharacterized protein (DUF488 family)